MKRFDTKEAREEIRIIKEQMLPQGWKAEAYTDPNGEEVFEVSLTKKVSGGLAGASYMLCEWTPRALKKLAEGIGAKRIKA